MGRHLQASFAQAPQVVITLPLLVGLDGKNKMSKSLGNYVGITENPRSMFGKIMSISDELMIEYFRMLTDVDIENIKTMHPKEAKLYLAETLTGYYHSLSVAKKEKEFFEKTFSKREIPSDVPVYTSAEDTVDLVEILYGAKLVGSKNEARRLLKQKGISCDYKPVLNKEFKLTQRETTLKIGKKKFIKIIHR